LISIPLLAVINIIIYAFIGYKELRYNIFLKQLLEPALRILGALMIAIYGLQVIEWSLIYVVSLVISALVGIWFFYRRIISPLQKFDREPVNIKEIISYSWPLSIATILTILIGQIDYILIGLYYPSADVGIYRIYIQIAAILQLILGSTARIYKPVISELIPQEQFTSIKETYQRVSRWVLTLTLLGFLVILLYGDVLVRALFTDAYGAYPAALSLLVLGILLNSSFGPEGVTLQAFGNTRLVLMNSLFSLLVNVGLGLLLIPRYGIVGAAVSTAITISLAGLLGMIEIYWLYRMQPFTFATLKIIGVGFFSGLIFAGINQFAPTSKISINLLRIVLLTIVFGLGFLLSRSMDSEDRQLIRQILQRITPNIS
jgi:O-antigen/teichoic acid export membrane protein